MALIRAETESPILSCMLRTDRVVMTAASGPIAVSMIISEKHFLRGDLLDDPRDFVSNAMAHLAIVESGR